MEHQTFSKHGLSKIIRKSDFLNIPDAAQETYYENLLQESVIAARTKFSEPNNPLSSFRLNGNLVFKLDKHADRIVERKLTANLRRVYEIRTVSRSTIIENLKLFLKEGIPFRVYRLDIRKFYESFSKDMICSQIDKTFNLSPSSKLLIKHILEKHSQLGGNGTPRGLPLSSCISELMMNEFDHQMNNTKNVFFYSRYVDDIILISSGNEDQKEFLDYIKINLPEGLILNPTKLEVSSKVLPLFIVKNIEPKKTVVNFEYLGYKFIVSNPYKVSESKIRVVEVDIATKKAKKYKLRLSRAFYDFVKTNNWYLLKDRIRYLSNNFRVFNPYIGKTKLAGIYHNYPEVQLNAKNLNGLDNYLRGIVLSKHGRLGQLVAPLLTSKMKRELLKNSFIRGHATKRFVHFSSSRINEIKKCWEY